jgi:hypothetical protein
VLRRIISPQWAYGPGLALRCALGSLCGPSDGGSGGDCVGGGVVGGEVGVDKSVPSNPV